jgi:hypothetical protein
MAEILEGSKHALKLNLTNFYLPNAKIFFTCMADTNSVIYSSKNKFTNNTKIYSL